MRLAGTGYRRPVDPVVAGGSLTAARERRADIRTQRGPDAARADQQRRAMTAKLTVPTTRVARAAAPGAGRAGKDNHQGEPNA